MPEVISDDIYHHIKNVIGYIYEDEKKDWVACSRMPEGHIFNHIQPIREWLDLHDRGSED